MYVQCGVCLCVCSVVHGCVYVEWCIVCVCRVMYLCVYVCM